MCDDKHPFVLNKEWFVTKRGANVDLDSLLRNIPGRVVPVDEPEKDIRAAQWPDVTRPLDDEGSALSSG